MTERKICLYDPGFWKDPSLWKVGKGYVPTESVIAMCLYAEVALVSGGLMIKQLSEAGLQEDFLYLVPVVFAIQAIEAKLDTTLPYWSFSRMVMEAKRVVSIQVNKTRQRLLPDRGDMFQAENESNSKWIDQLMQERRRVENELVTFGKRVLGREKRNS